MTPGVTYSATFVADVPTSVTAVAGSSAAVSIVAQSSPLEVRFAGGDARTVGRDSAYTLDAVDLSLDADAANGRIDPSTASFAFGCVLLSSAAACPAAYTSALAAAAGESSAGVVALPAAVKAHRSPQHGCT